MFKNDSFHFIKYFKYVKQPLFSFVTDYYKKDKFQQSWFGPIYPVYHPDDWDVPESISSIVVNPPVIQTPTSQPKTKIIPFIGERRRYREQVCSNYKQLGHNRVKCTNHVPLACVFTSQGEPSKQHMVRSPKV